MWEAPGYAALSVSLASPGSTFTTSSIPSGLWFSILNCVPAANCFECRPGPPSLPTRPYWEMVSGSRGYYGHGRGTRVAVVTLPGTEMIDIQNIDTVNS